MSGPPHSNSLRGDFAFQTSDQAGGASQQQSYGRYDAEGDHNASGASHGLSQSHGQDASMRYQDFGAPHGSQMAAHFQGFPYPTAAPLGWDWTNTLDFGEFTTQYEPQGELVQELQNQNITANDFSIPLPVTNAELAFQRPQQPQSAPPVQTSAQNPLSPPLKPPSRPNIQTSLKRKAESDPNPALKSPAIESHQAKRQNKSRQSSEASLTSPTIVAQSESPMPQTAAAQAVPEPASKQNAEVEKKKEQRKGTGPEGRVIDVSKPRRVVESADGADMLPAGKVFPIQIGSELFRLSGASISSDAPSYFSHFFSEQLHNNGGRAGDVRTLYIDRDPDTFRDIALHLQGYHITPKNGEQFVKMFADAQFYSLPRLTKQLFSTDIFIRIGGMPFQIPRDLFSSPGDSPNYFSLGFAQFFSTPSDSFPGLDRNALLRPPSISPPTAPSRDGATFGELIKILQGYKVDIQSEEHRSRLLRDARYFHLKGLEQRLIPCQVSYNLKRQQSEILIRLEDIRQSGISFTPDKSADSDSTSPSGAQSSVALSPGTSKVTSPAPSMASSSSATRPGYVSYARPYTDDHSSTNILILEVSSQETTTLFLPFFAPHAGKATPPTLNLRAIFHNSTLARITSLFSVVASKMGLPPTQPLGLMYLQTGSGVAAQPVSPANSGVSERRVRIRLDSSCALTLNGSPAELDVDPESNRMGIKRLTDARINNTSQSNGKEPFESSPKGHWIWGGSKNETQSSLMQADPEEQEVEWIIKRAHWRLRVEPIEVDGEKRMQVVLCGVKLEAFTVERTRNAERGFLV